MSDNDKLREALAKAHFYPGSGVFEITGTNWALIKAAAESTLPKTKMVEVWRVEYSSNGVPLILQFLGWEKADDWKRAAESLPYISCIRVTGPHQHEVCA